MSQDTLENFLSRNRINTEQWVASKLRWDDLEAIAVDYEREIPHLEDTAALLANIIQRFEAVHSVRWRVKNKDHLIAKIIRKCAEGTEKYLGISKENYNKVITDLIGIRAIHLFKDDVLLINESVKNSFALVDTPVVYFREGDHSQFNKQCAEMGFEVRQHPKGYRSIHYVIKTQPLKHCIYVELQVRTIFEEGWSEIDHIVHYPNYSDDAHLAYLLTIFNRMAGSADEMGGFVRALADELNIAKDRLDNAVREKNESFAKVDVLVAQLAAMKDGKSENKQIVALQAELKNLKAVPNPLVSSLEHKDLISKWAVLGLPSFPNGALVERLRGFDVSEGIGTSVRGLDVSGGIGSIVKGLNVSEGIGASVRGLDVSGGGVSSLKREKK